MKRYPRGTPSQWRVTVLSRDGQTLIDHHNADDWKEVQCICTVARHESISTQIWIRPPADAPPYQWD